MGFKSNWYLCYIPVPASYMDSLHKMQAIIGDNQHTSSDEKTNADH